MKKAPITITGDRGSGKANGLLAAVALQVVHRVDRHCISTNETVVVVHGILLGCRGEKYESLILRHRLLIFGDVVGSHYITGMTLLSFHYI